MTDYQRCPFCSGHEQVSTEAMEILEEAIRAFLPKRESPLKCELENIRNVILNHQEREAIDPLLL